MQQVKQLINGAHVTGHGDLVDVVNPYSEEVITSFREASADQVLAATQAARRSFEDGEWRHTPVQKKQSVLRTIAANIRQHSEELAHLQVQETGMTLASVPLHIESAARWFDFYADFLTNDQGSYFQQLGLAHTIVSREPIGVCALFSPWNVPVNLSAIKIAPALAAGNSIVLKPSEETPLCTQLLIDLIAAADLPAGVVNCLHGRGQITGAALASSPNIDMISFTGGHVGGQAVAQQAVQRNLPCIMELGGKSATIVFEDADLEAAAQGALTAIYANNGEACLAGSRILIQDSISEQFLTRFTQLAEQMQMGDPMLADTTLGPLINRSHQLRVKSFYDQAAEDGDEILFGNQTILPEQGYFVAPGAIKTAGSDSRIWQDEVFGPIAAIRTFQDEQEAIQLANDSRYGLSGYLWSSNIDRVMRVSQAMRTGTVVVNSSFMREQNAPFGGYKQSGIGREGGIHSWHNFTEEKAILIRQK